MPTRKALWVAGILGAAAVVGVASRIILPADNFIEQLAEKIIEKKTGANIDLSPDR